MRQALTKAREEMMAAAQEARDASLAAAEAVQRHEEAVSAAAHASTPEKRAQIAKVVKEREKARTKAVLADSDAHARRMKAAERLTEATGNYDATNAGLADLNAQITNLACDEYYEPGDEQELLDRQRDALHRMNEEANALRDRNALPRLPLREPLQPMHTSPSRFGENAVVMVANESPMGIGGHVTVESNNGDGTLTYGVTMRTGFASGKFDADGVGVPDYQSTTHLMTVPSGGNPPTMADALNDMGVKARAFEAGDDTSAEAARAHAGVEKLFRASAPRIMKVAR